jgi:F0F1-type ATP synthase membrane subunit c/vacuolar-type H+-ATPase subunit K
MLMAVGLYAVVGEIIGRQNPLPPNPRMLPAFTVVAVGAVIAILVVRRVMIAPSLAAVSIPAPHPDAIVRWRGGYIVTYVFAEAIALLGLVLRILGFRFRHVVSFYAAAAVLLLFFIPRRPAIR